MAEGTHMKMLEDSVKKTEAQLQHMQQLFATIKIGDFRAPVPAMADDTVPTDGNQEVVPFPPIIAEHTIEDDMSRSERNQPRRPKEDDRGHSGDDSQKTCDNDFTLGIGEIEGPHPWKSGADSQLSSSFKGEWQQSVHSEDLEDRTNGKEFRTDESQVFRQAEKIAIPTVEVEAPVVQDSPRIVDWEFKVLSEGVLGDVKAKLVDDNAVESRQPKEIPITIKEMNQQINIPEVLLADGWKERSNSENEANIDEHQIQPNFFEVNSNPCRVMVYDSAVEGLKKLLVLLIEWMEIRLANERTVSKTEIRVDVGKLFEEMPNMKLVLFDSTIELNKFSFQQLLEFSTLASNGRGGAAKFFLNWPNRSSMLIPYDRGKGVLSFCCWKGWSGPCIGVAYIKTLIFDPGGIYSLIVSKSSKFWSDGMIKVDRALGKKFVFDPGGVLVDHMHPQVISGNGYMGDANLATSSLCGCSCGLCSTGSYIVGWPCAVMDCEMVMVEHTTSHALFDQSGSHLAAVLRRQFGKGITW